MLKQTLKLKFSQALRLKAKFAKKNALYYPLAIEIYIKVHLFKKFIFQY